MNPAQAMPAQDPAMADPAAPPPMPPEVSKADLDRLATQIQSVEQAVMKLVSNLQQERDEKSRGEFNAEFGYEFGGIPEVAESCWRAWEESDKKSDKREFVSRMVANMDNQMVRYLAAKGMEVVMAKAESETDGDTAGIGAGDGLEADGAGEEDLGIQEDDVAGIGAGGALGGTEEDPDGAGEPDELSDRDKINRMLTQNEE